MSKLLILSIAVVTAVSAAAQDKIVWADGTTTTDAKVASFNLQQIKFSVKGDAQSKTSDQVERLDVDRVKDTYKRAYALGADASAPGVFLDQARKLVKKDPFLAQFGFLEAAQQMMGDNQPSQAFQVLEEMAKELPDAGFVPELYRMKLEYYLAQGKAGAESATKVAKAYLTAVNTQGFPEGYVHEAEFYEAMAAANAGTLNAKDLERKMMDILGKTEGTYPKVANRAKLQRANALRAEKKVDEARRIYAELLAKDNLGMRTRANARLGMGYLEMAQADANNKDAYKAALIDFLHVFVETPEAGNELVAEALYNGKIAAEKWGGLDAGTYSRRLDYILKKNPRYADTSWAKR